MDSLLRDWEVASPPGVLGGGADEAGWDENAARIAERARTAPGVSARELDVLCGAPRLEAEPGEPVAPSVAGGPGALPVLVGEKKMSDDQDPPSAARPSLRTGRSFKTLPHP